MTSALANSSFVLGDFELNETLCVHIDDKIEALVDMHEWRRSHGELADYMIPIILMCGSILALFFGATLFRPTAAFAAAMFSFYAIYGFARTIEGTISCETVLGVATTGALIAALATGCLIKMALFLIGAAATASLIHLTYSMFPNLHDVGDQPTIASRSVAYWGLMLLAGVGGGMVVRWHSVCILELLTACAGGAGLAFSMHALAITINQGHSPDRRIFFACGILSAMIGIIVQRRRRLRKKEEPRTQTRRARLHP